MRKAIFFGMALVAATQVGCRMCQNCLDYAPPVPGYAATSGCGPGGYCRSGSSLGDAGEVPMVAEQVSESPVVR